MLFDPRLSFKSLKSTEELASLRVDAESGAADLVDKDSSAWEKEGGARNDRIVRC